MPGIIIFKRRWSVGSDDMVLPSTIFFIFHTLLFFLLLFLFNSIKTRDWRYPCMSELYEHNLGYLIILIGCIITEFCICYISSKGTIMNNEPRSSMKYLLYVRCGILLVEIIWLCIGLIWLYNNYELCNHSGAKKIIFLITISNSIIIFCIIFIGWCSFDSAGRSWFKMKLYENNLKENSIKYKCKRSSNTYRNWRHREAARKYQDSWNRRCRLLFCCLGRSNRRQNSFAEIAKLLSDFFRDLDLVPSDVVTGLIIIRKYQKLQRKLMIENKINGIYEYMSGVPIKMNTQFLDLNKPDVAEEINTLIYYLDYAMAAYGWPIFVVNKKTACCKLYPYLKCNCCLDKNIKFTNCFPQNNKLNDLDEKVFSNESKLMISGDNCCGCNYAALKSLLKNKNYDLIYTNYHVDIGQPSFIAVLDHNKKTLIISVRGTLSLKDIITDLNAEGDILPIKPHKEKWMAHNGMIEAAIYIKNELFKNKIIEKALNFNLEKNTKSYKIVLVGHSLGAGTVSILAILLKELYPDLVCYAFSPPGGLLSLELVEHSKSFITSVVLGKDIVPRLGLHQMENLRFDLINAIKESSDPKWKIIGSAFCCCKSSNLLTEKEFLKNLDNTSIGELSSNFINLSNSFDNQNISCNTSFTKSEKELSTHPQDNSISLTVHQPFYPPGKIIHIVRYHSKNNDNKIVKKKDLIYKALYVDNVDFDQILITPVIVHDHMPNRIMEGLQKLFLNSNKVIKNKNYLSNVNFSNSSLKSYNMDHQSIKPLLSYQFNSNWSNNKLDKSSIPYLAYKKPNNDLNLKVINNELFDLYRLRNKKSQKTSLISLMKKIKNLDIKNDFWFGAPLASPETLSETSSICSRNYSDTYLTNKRNTLKTVSENVVEHNLFEVTNNIPSTTKKETIIQMENDSSPKLDLSLNIDVNKLFDIFEKIDKINNNPNEIYFKNLFLTRPDLNEDKTEIIKRTSSLKRTSSTSSSSSKRVTFNSAILVNSNETFKVNKKQFCQRSNSEKINRRKMFLHSNTNSNNNSNISNCLKLKQLKPSEDYQLKQKNSLFINVEKNNDEEDNAKNEKLEKQLEELLGYNFNYSDVVLKKNDTIVDEKLNIISKSAEKNNLNILDENIEKNLEINELTNSETKNEINRKCYVNDKSSNLNTVLENNLNEECISNLNVLVNDNKNTVVTNNRKLLYKNNKNFSIFHSKTQFQKFFQKLSKIESTEELDVCDKN